MPRCAVDPAVGAVQREPTSADPLKIVESVDDGAGRQPRTADAVGKHRYVLILQLEGASEVEQGCAKVSLKTNDLLLLDTRVPGRMRSSTRSRQLRVYLRDAPVSQQLAGRHPPPIGAISATCGLAVGLRCLILAMGGDVGRLTHQEQWGLQAALFDLALAAVGADPARSESGAPPTAAGLRRLALLQESVESRLSDPGLCPARIAAEHGISTRQLHRLFKQTGTPFGAFVRRRRLERCRDDLADPQLRPLPMTEIAFRWGFSDSAHFSRCFRAAFGCTARDFRAARFPSDEIARAAER
jgi:AraC-like DNA-binding protein